MDPEIEAAQRVGTTVCNKWRLERLIGTGGMAAVYVASHKIGRREAIKILHSEVARDPEVRARFEQEADAVNRFKHPGVVEVHDIDVAEDGSPFLVMELLEGQPLSELARQPGGVELGTLLRLTDEVLDVLAAAHAMGIIHRDIKPDNLFVQTDGRLKVLDFGIARVRAGAPAKLHTRVGATLGTAPYMPPEQIRGVEIDARADLFAVGATMFRIIAKRRVHEAASEGELLVKMASQQAPPLASLAPETPADVCLIVDRALMFDRALRYPDARTMQGDVRAVREGRPPPYGTAQAPGSLVLAPTPSDAITRDAPTRARTRHDGVAETSPNPADPRIPARTLVRAPALAPLVPSSATSPVATPVPFSQAITATSPGSAPSPIADPATHPARMVLGASGLGAPLSSPSDATPPRVSAAPATRPATGAGEPATTSVPGPPALVQIADPATRPARMVLGASGLGAPLAPSTPEPAADPATTATGVQAQVPARAPPIPPPQPSGERTLRSVQGPDVAGAVPAPQGYVIVTTALPEMRAPSPTSGPRTQVAGTAPPVPSVASVVSVGPVGPVPSAPLAPGESISVVAAPPRVPRRYTFPGTDISLVPLLAVGFLFAALGVGITLWFMLSNSDGSPSDGGLDLGQRGAHPGLHATTHAPAPKPTAHPGKQR